MQVWRIAKRSHALDRQGIGARLAGGRWNSPGVAAIYAGMTPEIAALEKLVHTSGILPEDLVLAVLALPSDEQLYQRLTAAELPAGWDALPSSIVAAKIGDDFLQGSSHLGLIVPSAIMPEASNIVLNPDHPTFTKISIRLIRHFEFDSRLST